MINLFEEEELSEEVRKYPCLYDKANKAYKDKRAKKNAWSKIDSKLGLEEGNIILFSCNTLFRVITKPTLMYLHNHVERT